MLMSGRFQLEFYVNNNKLCQIASYVLMWYPLLSSFPHYKVIRYTNDG